MSSTYRGGKAWPKPYTGRCLVNGQTRKWFGREDELRSRSGEEGERYDAAKMRGDFDIAAVIAGESAGLIRDVRSAAEIISSIVAQADEVIGAHRRSENSATLSSGQSERVSV